jgi:hypothetical protein
MAYTMKQRRAYCRLYEMKMVYAPDVTCAQIAEAIHSLQQQADAGTIHHDDINSARELGITV